MLWWCIIIKTHHWYVFDRHRGFKMSCITQEQIRISSSDILNDVDTMPMICTWCILKCQSFCQNTAECVAASEVAYWHYRDLKLNSLATAAVLWPVRNGKEETELVDRIDGEAEAAGLSQNKLGQWVVSKRTIVFVRWLLFISEKAFICCQCKAQKTKDHQEKVHRPLCENATPE